MEKLSRERVRDQTDVQIQIISTARASDIMFVFSHHFPKAELKTQEHNTNRKCKQRYSNNMLIYSRNKKQTVSQLMF